MKLYIIRHLQTEWNKKSVLQGSHDLSILPPTSEEMLEIEQNKKWLIKQKNNFDLVFTSSLQRTQQTAAYYGFTHVVIEPLLNELNFGEYEGRSRDELITAVGESWFEDPREIILGEPISNLEFRIQSFLEKYKHYKQLLIFAHGSWTRALISFVQFGNLKQMNQTIVKNNQLVELTYNDSQSEVS
jgi:probable phosphoglycerate mutase